jgi:hypothetical protein
MAYGLMKAKKTKTGSRHWLFLPAFAAFTFFLTELAARNPEFTEKYYTQGIYPVIAASLSTISSRVTFSLDDLIYGLLLSLPFILVALVILKQITLKSAGKIILNSLAVIYVAFYFLWGFNYYRSDLNQRIAMDGQDSDTKYFTKVLKELTEQLNSSQTEFEDITKAEVDSLIEESYKKWAPVLKLHYPMGKRRTKEISLSRFFAQAGISGYYGPFFSEVHVNRYNLPLEYPFVLAHEKAHQFGITSEAEASFYAWLVCTHSDSRHLKYSANLAVYRYFLFQGSRLEHLPQIIEKLDEEVKADFRKIREHWQTLRNENIDRAASKMNDAYLKTNKVEQGIQDYSGVVKYVMDFKTDSLFLSAIIF